MSQKVLALNYLKNRVYNYLPFDLAFKRAYIKNGALLFPIEKTCNYYDSKLN